MSYGAVPMRESNACSVASLKLTLVIVVNSPSMMSLDVSLSGVVRVFASEISAPVMESWSPASTWDFQQTPEFPVQPLHLAVCSHWKQNSLVFIV